jgi:hypothetical protein
MTGFVLEGVQYPTCNMAYHQNCIGVGSLFRSLYRDLTWGLFFPKTLVGYPFVCKLCTAKCPHDAGEDADD